MEHTLKNGIVIDIPEPHLGVSPWVVQNEKPLFSLTWNIEKKRFDLLVVGTVLEFELFDYYSDLFQEMQAACIEANELYQNILNQSK